MIDLHCDTIYRLWEDDDKFSLISNSYMIDKQKLIDGGVKGQCFALFTPMYDVRIERDRDKTPWQIVNELYDRFCLELERSGIPQFESVDDLDKNELSAILTIEEGFSIEGDLSRLSIMKDWGVKIFGFTWNFENDLGYPNSKDPSLMALGLKGKGIEAISECESLGILVDVSHLSDGGFWDVVKYSKKPFVATHSNSRFLTPSTRNLTDEMLKVLADKGGVTGLNFCPAFLKSENTPNRASLISDMVRHVKHIINVAGEDVIALGTDFDGISGDLEIASADRLPILKNVLLDAGVPAKSVDKMFYDNARRVLSC